MSKKILTGVVVSNKMEKTIVVSVQRTIIHPIYKKFLKTNKKFLAHDPENQTRIGDTVKIIESKPISKKKRWLLLEIIKRSESLREEIKATTSEGE